MTTNLAASASKTASYAESFPTKRDANFYGELEDLHLSTIGLGTYLGDATDEIDEAYEESIETAVRNGINIIDTAINYRFQRSERTIGKTLRTLFEETEFEREQIFVSTKGGFVPFEKSAPDDPLSYIQDEFIDPGIATSDDFTQNGHCMTPGYITNQVQSSLDNLKLDSLDLYYVHNPEAELAKKSPDATYDQLESVFERLEEFVRDGVISAYGVATWEGLRVDPSNHKYLKLEEIHARAEAVAGEDHHLSAVQLPLNLGMSEALTKANQPIEDERFTPLEAAQKLGLMVFTSASILQGRLTRNLPEEIRQDLSEFEEDVHRAIQFTRSCPGVTSALVGMSNADHVEQNLQLASREPFSEETFRDRFLEEI